MSAQISGEFVLYDTQPSAIWDQQSNIYRFYHTYRARISLNDIPLLRQDNERVIESVSAEIWIPTVSPVTPYIQNALVFIRGRIISPDQNISIENRHLFVIGIEAVSAQFRGLAPSCPIPVNISSPTQICPESTIIGKVVDLTEVEQGWSTLLIETAEEVGGIVEYMPFA